MLKYRNAEPNRHNDKHLPGKEVISYSIGQSFLGLVLAAQSERGLCCLMLGDDTAVMLDHLRKRFPYGSLAENKSSANSLMVEVIRSIESPRAEFRLPLDMGGTEFQRKVWNALLEIPRGTTATYAEIAKKIGAPKAVRAVGTACGANRIAVIVPCHRVIGSAGGLSGYRWGLERKRVLLEREAAQRAS